jgi:hypothetical protein
LFFGLIQSLGDQGAGLFIEHSGFLLRSVSVAPLRLRLVHWPAGYRRFPR